MHRRQTTICGPIPAPVYHKHDLYVSSRYGKHSGSPGFPSVPCPSERRHCVPVHSISYGRTYYWKALRTFPDLLTTLTSDCLHKKSACFPFPSPHLRLECRLRISHRVLVRTMFSVIFLTLPLLLRHVARHGRK